MSNTVSYSYTDDGRRYAGVLVHPTSFPSPYGIGDLGPGAYAFLDFLKAAGQTLWQVLPLGPTGFGDSPYQSFSSFAGQPLLISPDKLVEDGLLEEEDIRAVPCPAFDPRRVSYAQVIPYKNQLLRLAYGRFKASQDPLLLRDYFLFYKANKWWADDYAFFMAAKDWHEGRPFTQWEPELVHPSPKTRRAWTLRLEDGIRYYLFVQFLFFRQWGELRDYAHASGIQIIGDIPIFCAPDSADVWAHPELFTLDSQGFPTEVSGVPPDYFSADGQLWGNPLYRWEAHEQDGFAWWIRRIQHQLSLVDFLRIDHFRGFCACWSVAAGAPNARIGVWKPAPGWQLFQAVQAALGGPLPIIAEDLGIITPDVAALRDRLGLPGMKVLQFAFEDSQENDFLPHQFKTTNCLCYTGTHDNDTSTGWFYHTSGANRDKVRRYMNSDLSGISWDFIRICLGTIAKYALYPMQDLLHMGSDCRMNLPGVSGDNWCWRYCAEDLNPEMASALCRLTKLFGR